MGLEDALRQKCKPLVKKMGGVMLPLRGWIRGTPDALIAINGKLCLVEFKAPGGKLSASQEALHRQLQQAGVTVAVIRDVESFKSLLE